MKGEKEEFLSSKFVASFSVELPFSALGPLFLFPALQKTKSDTPE